MLPAAVLYMKRGESTVLRIYFIICSFLFFFIFKEKHTQQVEMSKETSLLRLCERGSVSHSVPYVLSGRFSFVSLYSGLLDLKAGLGV